MGYQEWRPFVDGQVTEEEVIRRWKNAEHGYARKQMTWFRKNERIQWFDIKEKQWQDKIEVLVKNWYRQENAQ